MRTFQQCERTLRLVVLDEPPHGAQETGVAAVRSECVIERAAKHFVLLERRMRVAAELSTCSRSVGRSRSHHSASSMWAELDLKGLDPRARWPRSSARASGSSGAASRAARADSSVVPLGRNAAMTASSSGCDSGDELTASVVSEPR